MPFQAKIPLSQKCLVAACLWDYAPDHNRSPLPRGLRMKCSKCGHENHTSAKFCEECGIHFLPICTACRAPLSATARFCSKCGHPAERLPPSSPSSAPRFDAPQAYTPGYLAEKILTSKSALEGERKQVTVLFADLKGSMELFADRDTRMSTPSPPPTAIGSAGLTP